MSDTENQGPGGSSPSDIRPVSIVEEMKRGGGLITLPVVEGDNGLLFYPVQYEGEESEKNVIYTGAAPNANKVVRATIRLLFDEGVEEIGVSVGPSAAEASSAAASPRPSAP